MITHCLEFAAANPNSKSTPPTGTGSCWCSLSLGLFKGPRSTSITTKRLQSTSGDALSRDGAMKSTVTSQRPRSWRRNDNQRWNPEMPLPFSLRGDSHLPSVLVTSFSGRETSHCLRCRFSTRFSKTGERCPDVSGDVKSGTHISRWKLYCSFVYSLYS
jgi:hypothetical protein